MESSPASCTSLDWLRGLYQVTSFPSDCTTVTFALYQLSYFAGFALSCLPTVIAMWVVKLAIDVWLNRTRSVFRLLSWGYFCAVFFSFHALLFPSKLSCCSDFYYRGLAEQYLLYVLGLTMINNSAEWLSKMWTSSKWSNLGEFYYSFARIVNIEMSLGLYLLLSPMSNLSENEWVSIVTLIALHCALAYVIRLALGFLFTWLYAELTENNSKPFFWKCTLLHFSAPLIGCWTSSWWRLGAFLCWHAAWSIGAHCLCVWYEGWSAMAGTLQRTTREAIAKTSSDVASNYPEVFQRMFFNAQFRVIGKEMKNPAVNKAVLVEIARNVQHYCSGIATLRFLSRNSRQVLLESLIYCPNIHFFDRLVHTKEFLFRVVIGSRQFSDVLRGKETDLNSGYALIVNQLQRYFSVLMVFWLKEKNRSIAQRIPNGLLYRIVSFL